MTHKPIHLKNIGLSFLHKICFKNLTTQINHSDRIAIIGRNGTGKSALLKALQGIVEPSEGEILQCKETKFGYLPQDTEEFETLSGGQRLNKILTSALAESPQVLLLDEPTNHLDLSNRRSLMRMLQNYKDTLIVVSHDTELLRSCIDTIWHIENERVYIFSGNYDEYLCHKNKQKANLNQNILRLKRDKKQAHLSLMHEQERAKKRKIHGEKKYASDKLSLRSAQSRGESTSNKNLKAINAEKNLLLEQLKNIDSAEIIKPKFFITTSDFGHKNIVTIKEGLCSYGDNLILRDIHLSLKPQERLAIIGDNGSGKSTLIKAILGDLLVTRSGIWMTPQPTDIGYLDQHHNTLNRDKTSFESIHDLVPTWSQAEIRKHLNNFLFRTNEEVNIKAKNLSGGERTRLSLAQIAAKIPKLLILDEITNNLDLETKEHVIQVLKNYPGAMIIISHEETFLRKIDISNFYKIKEQKLNIL